MTKLRSTFKEYLDKLLLEGTEYLRQHNWLDQSTGGPLIDQLDALVIPYLGKEDALHRPPDDVRGVIDQSNSMGTAHEALGNLQAALAWYHIGQYQWCSGEKAFTTRYRKVGDTLIPEEIPYTDGLPDLMHRDAIAPSQLQSAICANRVGKHERAHQHYEWAAQNYNFPDDEIKFHEKVRQYMVLWQSLSYRSYALLCLERWKDALSVAEQGQSYIEKDRQVPATYTPVVLYPIIHALASYKINPSDENRRKAIEMLSPQSVATRNHVGHLWGLFYLYNLRARHPELADPQPEELPLAERARQGAEACIKWMALGGVTLDGTPESLKLLDENMHLVFHTLDSEDKRKQGLFLWGSYLGETIGKELAGGQWNMTGENMLKFSLNWDMGEVELHLWAYQHVHEYATGKTEKGLYQLWKETEQAYLDFGLAANLAE